MTSMTLFLWIVLGIALQVGLVLGIGFWRYWRSYRQLGRAQGEVDQSLAPPDVSQREVGGWHGFRAFEVTGRVMEDAAGQICSFYLKPKDGQPLPPCKPGQFLTFRLDLPRAGVGGTEPVTRCYSLSEAPRPERYRVTIKRQPAPPGSTHPPGRASNFFHDQVEVGTTLEVRAPSGQFFLEPGSGPMVLIAGGIGVTPLLSMLDWCQGHQPEREVWFFYGARNSREAAFTAELRATAAANPNLHLRLCLLEPRPEDQPGQDFHHQGLLDVGLLRMALPLKPYHYYVCGPAPMMEALVPALEDWGVPESHIHFEAFGPASIRRRGPQAGVGVDAVAGGVIELTVTFARSGKRAQWQPRSGSLLEFAESQGIAIDSACREGKCGTCQTAIRAGEVSYRQAPEYDPEPGTCLPCVCTPRTNVTLEA